MTEEEYWEDEYNDQDDILGDYLIDEVDDDLTLIMMPKITYDYEREFETYYKMLKKCRTKDQMKTVLSGIIRHTSTFNLLANEINYLQNRAQSLEYQIQLLQLD